MEEGAGLHLGSGHCKWEGWVNVDLEGADLNCDIKKLPFPDNSQDNVAAIHVFEHLYRWEVDDAVKEWARVLKPGGKLILELPDLAKVMHMIVTSAMNGLKLSPSMSWHALWGDPKYKNPAMNHKWGYTESDVMGIMKDAGLVPSVEKARYHFAERDMRIVGVKP